MSDEEKGLIKSYEQHPALVGSYQELVDENLGDEGLKPSDLPMINIPTGGIKRWEVPSLGEPEMVKTIKGVIIHKQMTRAFWSKGIEEAEDTLPDCMSRNGKTGEVINEEEWSDLGGDCATCPMNEWGSGKNGRGKACTAKMQMYVLKEGTMLPNIISLSPTSIKPARDYLVNLVSYGKPYHTVITKFELETVKNDDGIKYSKAIISYEDDLPPETSKKVNEFRENFITGLKEFTAEDMK